MERCLKIILIPVQLKEKIAKMRSIIALIFLLGTISASYAETETWYKLDEDEVYVTDFLLQARQSKEISIDSTQPIIVGFETDTHYAPNSYELYEELSAKYKSNVIKMDSDSGNSMSTISGGSMMYKPVNGKIDIETSNLTDRDFKIVIYRKNVDEV